MTKYIVTKRNGQKFTVEGDSIEQDGMGTRVLLEGAIQFTTPEMAEVVPEGSAVSSDAPEPEEEATGSITKKKTVK